MRRFRGDLIAGLLVVVPAYVSIWVLDRFVLNVQGVLAVIPSTWRVAGWPVKENLVAIPGLGILMTALVLLLVGALARTYLGRRVTLAGDQLFDRIPFLRSIYSASKQVLTSVLHGGKRQYGKVVMVEYPRRGCWSVAFLSAEGFEAGRRAAGEEDLVAVFLPTTPNPTSGLLLYMPRDEVHEVDLSTEEAFRLVMSFGVARPETLDRDAKSPERHETAASQS
jgi:uncharacterized membrane protein